MDSGEAYFHRDGAAFVPTGQGASPWSARAQGGVPLAGLTAHVLGAVAAPAPMQLARLTIDILGAVPMAPLTPSVEIVREGRRVQLVDIRLAADGRTRLRASALRVRIGESPAQALPLPHPLPEASPRAPRRTDWGEMVDLAGAIGTPGPAAMWVRFHNPVVAGESLTPLERVAMLADWGGGLSSLVPFSRWSFANLDISLNLLRQPEGDWMLIDAASDSAGGGLAVARSRLGDRTGMFGAVHQTIFVDPREGGPREGAPA